MKKDPSKLLCLEAGDQRGEAGAFLFGATRSLGFRTTEASKTWTNVSRECAKDSGGLQYFFSDRFKKFQASAVDTFPGELPGFSQLFVFVFLFVGPPQKGTAAARVPRSMA